MWKVLPRRPGITKVCVHMNLRRINRTDPTYTHELNALKFFKNQNDCTFLFLKPYKKMRKLFFTFTVIFHLSNVFCQDRSETNMVAQIKKEGTDHSEVMDIARHLTDKSGPRLTNSPGFMRAANWAKDELTRWGLVNAQLEPWGEFGKGWQQEKCYVAMVSPYYQPLIAIPRAWTGGTGKKILRDEIVLVKAEDTTALAQYAGKLKDKIVMLWSSTQLKPSFEADANRFADTTLERMAAEEMHPAGPNQQQNPQRQNQFSRFAMQRRMNEMIIQQKPALVLTMNQNGSDGTVFVASGGQYARMLRKHRRV